MEIRMQLEGISERWNPDDDTYIHCVHLVFAGHTFDFQVTAEVAAEIALATKGDRSGLNEAASALLDAAASNGAAEAAESNAAMPPAMDGFSVAMPDAAEETVPVPSTRGQQPVPRGNVQDAPPSGGDGEAFSQG